MTTIGGTQQMTPHKTKRGGICAAAGCVEPRAEGSQWCEAHGQAFRAIGRGVNVPVPAPTPRTVKHHGPTSDAVADGKPAPTPKAPLPICSVPGCKNTCASSDDGLSCFALTGDTLDEAIADFRAGADSGKRFDTTLGDRTVGAVEYITTIHYDELEVHILRCDAVEAEELID